MTVMGSKLRTPETYLVKADGPWPGSPLPLLVYRDAVPGTDRARVFERSFDSHDWGNTWRDGIYDFHHFHSTAHEVLGIAVGTVNVRFGGERGLLASLSAGDAVVIPAGVAHCNEGGSLDLLVVGGNARSAGPDLRRGDPAEREFVERNLASLATPVTDPISGAEGPLPEIWVQRQE
jgi:uncharacterized protein YjlB